MIKSSVGTSGTLLQRVQSRAAPPSRRVHAAAMQVRPYTARVGDTLTSIANKRGIDLVELVKLNHEIDPDNVREGQTILVPAGRLSDRDREILAGMTLGSYRTYPVRPGESLDDILVKRKITMVEFQALNPDVNPKKIADNQIIKLPRNKYTVREREMLVGAGAPQEWFAENQTPFGLGLLVGAAVYAAVTYVLRKHRDDDDEGQSA